MNDIWKKEMITYVYLQTIKILFELFFLKFFLWV
jgi:hypothetical protein